jgi:hypothetical protein
VTVSSHRRLRPMGAPFVAAVPTGRRVRTGLVVCESDTVVLVALGGHLGRLAGAEQAERSRHARGGVGVAPGAQTGTDAEVAVLVGWGDHPYHRQRLGPGVRILDNLNTHKGAHIRAWQDTHPGRLVIY